MKRTTLSLLLIFSMMFSVAQSSKMELSEKFKIQDKGYSQQFLSHAVHFGVFFYTVTNTPVLSLKGVLNRLSDLKLDATLSKYDKNMNLVKRVDLDNGERNFGPIVPELIYINNTLFIGYYRPINKSSFSFYLAHVNEDLSLGDSLRICTINQKNLGLFNLSEALDANFITITNSPDSKRILLVARIAPKQLQTFITDNNLKLLKQTELQIDMQVPEIETCLLSASDVETILITENAVSQVIAIKPDGVKNEIKVSVEQGFTSIHSNITPSRDGQNIYLYSTTARSGSVTGAATGISISSLDCNSLQLGSAVHYLFTEGMVEQLCNQGAGRKYKGEFYLENFKPDLMELENGEKVIFSCTERILFDKGMGIGSNGQPAMEYATYFIGGPIMAFYLQPDNKTLVLTSIPRNLFLNGAESLQPNSIHVKPFPGSVRTYLSYIVVNKGDKFVIIYTDSKNNLEQDMTEKPRSVANIANTTLVEASLNSARKIEYRKAFDIPESHNLGFLTGSRIPGSPETIVIPVEDFGKKKFSEKTKVTNWCFLKI